MINEQPFRGTVNPDNVIEAVCAAFTELPAGCRNTLKDIHKTEIIKYIDNRNKGLSAS